MAKRAMYCKELMVRELSEHFKDSSTLILTRYKGLSSQELNALRKNLRNISDEYIVVKDSIARKAIVDGPNSAISDLIKGEVGIVIDKRHDLTDSSKVLIKFSKSHEVFKILGGIVKGGIVSKEDIVTFASLPSREVLLGRLANVLNAPIQTLAARLQGILSKFVYALNAIKDKKEDKKEE